jgi:MarR family 2-MHQ and catechol resistance regulon transcriptional repressor
MQSRAKNIRELFDTTAMTQRLMHTYVHRTFDELGVAPSQLHLLHLIEHMQPVSLKKLAEAMRLTPGAITQIVESLVQAGYIDRKPDTQDRRVSVVTLTDAAREKMSALTRTKQAMLTKVVADLDDDELRIYLRVQQKMLAYLEANCRNVKN